MIEAAVIHEPDYPYVFPKTLDTLCIRLKCRKQDLKKCSIVYFDKYQNWQQKVDMEIYASGKYHDIYQGFIKYSPFLRYLKYCFQLTDQENRVYWFNDYGFYNTFPEKGFFQFSYLNQNDLYNSPRWLASRVFYQIFIDRFYDGNRKNNPKHTLPWGSKPNSKAYMGGDLQGIIAKIDYLRELGVNGLYLTPVFHAYSYHKYDTLDYYKIDPAFGQVADLKELVSKCHYYDIKVVLDGVFNHCSYYFKPFQDVVKRGKKSKYYNWFLISGEKVSAETLNYQTTGYYSLMPKLNLANPELRKYILQVVEYWMRETNIDGWRLDVADEVEEGFLKDLRRLVKSINKEAVLIGEIWFNGRKMLKGDQVDSVMNYLFRDFLLDFFARDALDVEEFIQSIDDMRVNYPEVMEGNLLNLIDSHDTERFLTSCKGKQEKFKLAVGFQLTFTGIPMIFYGDEVGISGENDPDCRKAMVWEKESQNLELLKWYQRLLKIRKELPEFTQGIYQVIHQDKRQNAFIFKREYQDRKSYVIINNSPREWNLQLELPASKYLELMSESILRTQEGSLKFTVAAYGFLILTESRGELK